MSDFLWLASLGAAMTLGTYCVGTPRSAGAVALGWAIGAVITLLWREYRR